MKNGNIRSRKTKPATGRDSAPRKTAPRQRVLHAKRGPQGSERTDALQVQAALYRIASAASAISDLPTFYAELHRIVGELMYAPSFSLLLIDHARQLGHVAYWADEAGDPPPPPVPFSDLLTSRRLVNVVLDSGKTLHVSREQIEEMKRQGKVDPYGTVAEDWIGVPLVHDGRVDGLLVVQSYKQGIRYSEQDAELLTFVAQHIAVALTRARAIEETRQRAAELAVINSVQQALASKLDMQAIYDLVGDKIRDIFDAQVTVITSFDPSNDLIHYNYLFENGVRLYPDPHPPGPLAQRFMQTRESMVVRTLQEYREAGAIITPGTAPSLSGVYVPLFVGGELRGGISLQNLDRENAFGESDVRLLETLASSMSVALENARLFEAERQRAAELALINSVQAGLASKLQMQAIYDLVGDKIREIFDAETMFISIVDPATGLASFPYFVSFGQRVYDEPLTRPTGFGGHVMKTRQPLLLNRVDRDLMREYGSYTMGLEDNQTISRSWMGAPILAGDKSIGVISIQQRRPDAFTESDLRLLTTLSNSMSVALENARLFEAERQRAAELAVINSVQQALASKLDFQGIIDLVGDKLSEVFQADVTNIRLYNREENVIEYAYMVDHGERYEYAPEPPRGFSLHIIETRQPIIIHNHEEHERRRAELGSRTLGGTTQDNSFIYVPILRSGQVTGIIVIGKLAPNAFSDSDLNLLTTLANSMSVALENARLFDEVQTRNREVTEALEQQTATSEILGVIAESPSDIQPVLRSVAANAARLCAANDVQIYQVDGPWLRQVTHWGPLPALRDGEALPLAPTLITGRAVLERRTIHIEDVEQVSSAEFPESVALQRRLGHRTVIVTPLLREDTAVGAIVVRRNEVLAFTEKQIELLGTFSKQAAIAIENVRLFTETQRLLKETEQRNAELQIINSIQQGLAAELDFQSIVDLVGDKLREVFQTPDLGIRWYDEKANLVHHLYEYEHGKRLDIAPRPPKSGGLHDIMSRTRQPVVLNTLADIDAMAGPPIPGTDSSQSMVQVPIISSDRLIGGIIIENYEREYAFSDADVRLLTTIAASLGTALENARLFNETQRLLKETAQRATELEIINGIQAGLVSKLDVDAIYELVGEKLRQVFPKFDLILGLYDPDTDIATAGYAVEHGKRLSIKPFHVAGTGFLGEMIRTRRAVLINENMTEAVKRAGSYIVDGTTSPKSALYVPLVVGDTLRGVVVLQHMEREHAFLDSDVRLLETIANSMSVALENARLLDETQRLLKETEQRNAELTTVNRVSQALTSQVELAALIQLAGNQIRDSFHADIAYIALLDRESSSIRFPYTFGEDLTPMKLGEGMASKIIQTGQPLLINRDMETRRAEMGTRRVGHAAKSYIGVPIVIGEEAIGVISVQSTHEEGRFDENDERLLATIAANVGAAIEKARLFDETVKQREYLEAVLQTSPVAITLVDPEQRVVSWNPAAEKLFGYTQAEAIGRNVDDLVANIPEIRADAERFTPKSYQGYTHHAITKRTRKDGSLVDVELFGELLQLGGKVAGGFAIYHDITEIQRARQAAEDANRAKSTFLANMSHELRTPLNAIIGFTRIVRRKSDGVLPEKQIENLDKVLVSADHLLSLINTVLDIAKIEAGRMDVSAAHFDMRALVDLCATTAQPLLKPGVALEKDVPAELPLVYSDQDKVKQITLNLLSNAAKFTHAGTITIRARAQGNALSVAVSDTGIGIAPDALERIFEEFQQADSTTTRQYGGTGLGLSISRSLARLLGGDLTATSTPGLGSTFTLSIPLHYGEKPAPTPQLPETDMRQAPHPSGKPTVLAIDDDPDVIFLLRENLGEAGYNVIGATSGDEGLEAARRMQPLAITLDIMMPRKDGWQILHELKSDPLTCDIPVLLLTIVDKRTLGYQLGAADYLLKPFDADQVLRALRRLARLNDGVAPRRLLVVDDDPNVIEMVKQLLEGADYQIDAAPDGQVALDAMAAHKPDALLLDLMMPQVDGFAVIEHMRAQPELARIPVIVLTAKELTADESACLTESIEQVIHKDGLDGQVLIDNLQRVLEKYRE